MTTDQVKDLALEALHFITRAIKGSAGKSIADVLTAIDVVAEGILRAAGGDKEVTAEAIREEMAKLLGAIETTDAHIDQLVREKEAAAHHDEEPTDPGRKPTHG